VNPLLKGLTILALFDAEHRDFTLEELYRGAGLPRMTAYRLIRTMESASYLVRDRITNRYHLGPALISKCYLAEGYSELLTVARPYLHELMEETRESAMLSVEMDGVAVRVAAVDTPRPFRREVALGRIIGHTASAGGKVLAAFKTSAERAQILQGPCDRSGGSCPAADPVALDRELQLVAREGVAFDIEECNAGTCAVAAPVRDQLGNVVAAISVVVPAGRFGPSERIVCTRAVKSAADRLSSRLRCSSSPRPHGEAPSRAVPDSDRSASVAAGVGESRPE
jgi:IclR family pca regulon transcriptional regulator